ncbi:ABC transporter permease [Amycolatopsis sp. BJA-103]|uniref:FtsX-like permease family protein n=1 Tax=unclassified Amycolatopsis TaxID=2618356 RepID=UPI000C782779|nr:ABC transporter permease [Amycolatopsis sp. BJA-103]AUI56941.1 ABC transporter permease [Amycolatopsis sp. BJA-103]PNE13334.1 ABC transporter permease [Amycolatopsis sp. BJA-103]
MIAAMALWVGGIARVRPARLGVPAAGVAIVTTLLAVHGWTGAPAPPWVPATVLVVLLAAPSERSLRGDQDLLRARGATGGQVLGLASAEAAAAGLAGGVAGVALSLAAGFLPGSGLSLVREIVLLLLGGLVVAALAVLPPVLREWYFVPADDGPPWWTAYGLDFVLLALAFFWPLLGWAGGTMLLWRLVELGLRKGKRAIGGALRPLVSGLAGVLALSISWRSALLARSVALVALAVAFAISSALTRDGCTAATVDRVASLLLAAAAAGPSFGLALNERRRDLLIVSTLGGKRRQVATFIAGDALIVGGGGLIAGHLLGVLFVLLTPVEWVAFPHGYFGMLGAVVIVSCVVASARIAQLAARDEVSDLRDY